MRAVSLFAALVLVGTAIALVPSGEAMQAPPPCQAMTTCCGIEPSFAPCCSPVSCPPPVYRCPDLDVDTTQYVLLAGPSAGAETDYDCSANACLNDADCSDASCAAGDQFCCSLDGAMSYCTQVAFTCQMPVGPAVSARMALPVRLSYTVNDDCSVTVREDMTCPAGYQVRALHYDAKVADVTVEYCAPIIYCTCPPMETMAADIDPFPTCVQDCFWFVPDSCDLQALWSDGPVGFPVDPWVGDCDIDVDPIGACAPPSGDSVERQVGPVHLHLLLCGGDVPDWS